jgi:hypothetical protein
MPEQVRHGVFDDFHPMKNKKEKPPSLRGYEGWKVRLRDVAISSL